MVSRRNFFTIMILLAVMVFMFMFVSVIKQQFNKFDLNENGMERSDEGKLLENYEELQEVLQSIDTVPGTVIYLTGESESPVDRVVESWGAYTKQAVITRTTLSGLSHWKDNLPKTVIVNGEGLSLEQDADILTEFAKKGVCVIFATMPEPKVIENSETLRKLMGITNVYSESVWLDSMHLFPGFLIGSETIYEGESGGRSREDKEFQVPWYMVGEGTKTYMMGVVDDSTLKNQFMPTILWRNSVGEGNVFCINGEFMHYDFGVGLLTACLAQTESYYIYPVVNAQNLVLANYSGFSEENSAVLRELYNQNQISFFRDTVWPTITAMNESTAAKISLMAAPQIEYRAEKSAQKDMLVYYLRLLKEGGGEAGITTVRFSDISLEEKLERDKLYWNSEADHYEVRSAFLGDPEEIDTVRAKLPDVRTVVTLSDSGMPVEYLDEKIIVQRATNQGVEYEFLDDFANKSYETALGYSCIVLDMTRAAYPDPDMEWNVYAKKVTSNLSTHWKAYKGFAQTTVSESDARIRRFFALNYSSVREGDTIRLHVDGLADRAYFVLKLHGEYPAETTEVPYEDLGNGFYLLEISSPDSRVVIDRDQRFYK